MGLALTLIDANTRSDHGLIAALPRLLSAIQKQGVDASSFALGHILVPADYADTLTESLCSYSTYATFRQLVRSQPGAPQRFRHLLEHSDCDGFYVPIDF